MCTEKIHVSFCGNLDTKLIAQLTALFSFYRVNILDINMFNVYDKKCTITIICQCSSTTDEIDSFWNELLSFSKSFNLNFSKKYVN